MKMSWPDKDFRYGRWEKVVDTEVRMLRCPACKSQVNRDDYESAIGLHGIRYCPYCGEDMWSKEESMKEICKNCANTKPTYKGIICTLSGKKTKQSGTCDEWRKK